MAGFGESGVTRSLFPGLSEFRFFDPGLSDLGLFDFPDFLISTF